MVGGFISCKLYTVLVTSLLTGIPQPEKKLRYFCERIYSFTYQDLLSRFLILANVGFNETLAYCVPASYSGCHPSNN